LSSHMASLNIVALFSLLGRSLALQVAANASTAANLAFQCPTEQSPTMWHTFESKYCVDGSLRDEGPFNAQSCTTPDYAGTCQSVCHTAYGANAWFEVTLAGAATIEEVRVVNAWAHCCKGRIDPFYMRLLDSAGSEISSQRFTGTLDEYVWSGIGVSGVSKVKIQLDKTDYLHMAEVFVHGTGVNPCGGPPTPAPAPPAPPMTATAAVGDPHLQNVHGERFDLMKPGKHVLINIPRGVTAEKSLLQVQAEARHLGGQCADMYFQEVNVTGSWAEAKKAGGYHYSTEQDDAEAPEWVAFGKVGLKIVHGRTDSGLLYLNVYVKHLGRAGFAVGGLLGEDDHEDVITPPADCANRMSLLETGEGGQKAPSLLSVAVASLA